MEDQQEIVDAQELKACLEIIERLVCAESEDAERRANELGATALYHAEMRGYSKGVSVWGTKVVLMIQDMFCRV